MIVLSSLLKLYFSCSPAGHHKEWLFFVFQVELGSGREKELSSIHTSAYLLLVISINNVYITHIGPREAYLGIHCSILLFHELTLEKKIK